jgi:hypothetical protein
MVVKREIVRLSLTVYEKHYTLPSKLIRGKRNHYWHRIGNLFVMEKKTQLNSTDKLLKAILSDDLRKFRAKQQKVFVVSKAS